MHTAGSTITDSLSTAAHAFTSVGMSTYSSLTHVGEFLLTGVHQFVTTVIMYLSILVALIIALFTTVAAMTRPETRA